MNTKPETYEVKQYVEITTQLDVLRLEDGLYLVRREISSKEDGKQRVETDLRANKAATTNQAWSGFVNDNGLAQLMDGKVPSKSNELALTFLNSSQREGMRVLGYPTMIDRLWKERGEKKQDVWEQWHQNSGTELDDLVRLDHSDHRLYDRHGQPLPVALTFDYINNHVDETRYNLEGLFEHLSGREDVCVLPGNPREYEDQVHAKSYSEAEFRIPHYNADEGRTRSLQFVWMPTAEDYIKVFGKNGEDGMRHWRVLESDVLGMNTFRTGTKD